MSEIELQQQINEFQSRFDLDSRAYFTERVQYSAQNLLFESMSYSFFSGGKRFRPFLSYLTASAFKKDPKTVFPVGLAIELVHTYSLIHDDLPCMDNDDLRRGKPTNHKIYGEDIALLAGDALLTESFAALALAGPHVGNLIHDFVSAIGAQGMVLGQVLDMKSNAQITIPELNVIHELKTGRLISAALFLSAKLFTTNDEVLKKIKRLGDLIGVSFQIKDDLLDALEKDQDFKSYVHLAGSEKTLELLNKKSEEAKVLVQELHQALAEQGIASEFFRFLPVIDYNQNRSK